MELHPVGKVSTEELSLYASPGRSCEIPHASYLRAYCSAPMRSLRPGRLAKPRSVCSTVRFCLRTAHILVVECARRPGASGTCGPQVLDAHRCSTGTGPH